MGNILGVIEKAKEEAMKKTGAGWKQVDVSESK
jgi:hypothetical protein